MIIKKQADASEKNVLPTGEQCFFVDYFERIGYKAEAKNDGIYICGCGPFKESLWKLISLLSEIQKKEKERFMTEQHKAYRAIMERIINAECSDRDIEVLKIITKLLED